MIIHVGEYKLRPFCIEDVESFYEIAHDEMVKKYVTYAYPENIKEAEELVYTYANGDLNNDFYLLIEKNNYMIGVIIAVKTIGNALEVSVFLSEKYRGRGIMTIIMKSFINWIHKNTEYEKMIMAIDKENIASNYQIKKIGGTYKRDYKNNKIYEVLIR